MTRLTQGDHPAPTTLTIGQLAKRHRVSRQAISERVKRLATLHSDFEVRRDGRGRIVAVPVAQYEELIGTFGDSGKRPVDSKPPAPAADAPRQEQSLDDARLLAARVSAERAAMQLAREKGELVRRDGIEAALEEAGVEIGGVLDRLPRHADDLAVAVSQKGVQGLRVALKKLSRDLRTEIADRLDRLRDAAPDEDGEDLEQPADEEAA